MQTAQALLAFALALSIPIVLFGSSLVVRLLERYPRASWLGALALIKTAAEMILDEPATCARRAAARGALRARRAAAVH